LPRMEDEWLYRLALTLVPQIGDIQARELVTRLGSAKAVFTASLRTLETVEGMGRLRARAIRSFRGFQRAEEELRFVEKKGITPLFLTDPAYPQRLLHCADAPLVLFYKGSASLNVGRTIGIVGTRSNTAYGRSFTQQLVEDLGRENLLIVSGLAMGIDAIAHRAALKVGLPTLGVVAHSLDKIYPAEHAGLAREMIAQGGLLSEFFSGTKPDRHHFPLRNRIVAGLCDALVVIETDRKGGSMITAKLADAYHRDVFALPGRNTDPKSSGCNWLIRQKKAMLLQDAAQLLEEMGWASTKPLARPQRELFIELPPQEATLLELLSKQESISLDELNLRLPGPASNLATSLLALELKGLIQTLPGLRYRAI
jgi:DNA processing protein